MKEDTRQPSYLALSKSAVRHVEAEHAEVSMSAIGVLKSDAASFKMSSAGVTLAGTNAELSLSTATVVAARRDITLTTAGGQWITAGNNLAVRNGGAAVMAARSITVDRGAVGLVIAQHAHLGDGARVLLEPRRGVVLAGSFGVGALCATLLGFLLRRRR